MEKASVSVSTPVMLEAAFSAPMSWRPLVEYSWPATGRVLDHVTVMWLHTCNLLSKSCKSALPYLSCAIHTTCTRTHTCTQTYTHIHTHTCTHTYTCTEFWAACTHLCPHLPPWQQVGMVLKWTDKHHLRPHTHTSKEVTTQCPGASMLLTGGLSLARWRLCIRWWTAPVQPFPVKRTLSCSEALTAFRMMSLREGQRSSGGKPHMICHSPRPDTLTLPPPWSEWTVWRWRRWWCVCCHSKATPPWLCSPLWTPKTCTHAANKTWSWGGDWGHVCQRLTFQRQCSLCTQLQQDHIHDPNTCYIMLEFTCWHMSHVKYVTIGPSDLVLVCLICITGKKGRLTPLWSIWSLENGIESYLTWLYLLQHLGCSTAFRHDCGPFTSWNSNPF